MIYFFLKFMFFIEPFIFSLRMPVSKLQQKFEELLQKFKDANSNQNYAEAHRVREELSKLVVDNHLHNPNN